MEAKLEAIAIRLEAKRSCQSEDGITDVLSNDEARPHVPRGAGLVFGPVGAKTRFGLVGMVGPGGQTAGKGVSELVTGPMGCPKPAPKEGTLAQRIACFRVFSPKRDWPRHPNFQVVMELNFRREKDPAANARKACGDLVQKAALARGGEVV